MDSCIFCRVAHREIPHFPVYENDDVLAFLDIHPLAKGHTLLIPKKHIDHFAGTDEANRTTIFNAAHTIMPHLKKALGADYVLLFIAGNDVDHFHVHLVPQWSADSILTNTMKHILTPEEFERIRMQISETMPAE